MSDYLWDKTGEADPEVERLEGLLGGFAHRPGRLELPPEAAAPARAGRSPRLVWYAAAAALLLAALAGALVALRPAERQEARLPAPQNSPAAPSAVPAAAPSVEPDAPAFKEREDREAAVEVVKRVTPRHRASQARAPREPAGRRRAAPAEVLEAPEVLEVARVEEVEEGAPMPGRAIAAALGRGFSVKRQLFNALLLTSTKLKEVQRQTQGADAEAPAERNRSR